MLQGGNSSQGALGYNHPKSDTAIGKIVRTGLARLQTARPPRRDIDARWKKEDGDLPRMEKEAHPTTSLRSPT